MNDISPKIWSTAGPK